MKQLLAFLFVLLLATGSAGAYGRGTTLDDVLRQRKQGWVYDYVDLLTPAEEAQLNQRISELELQGEGQMAVVLVDQLKDARGNSYSPFDYGWRVFQQWGIGHAREDDGILLLVSIHPRKLFIVTGYGKEGRIMNTDALCSRICAETIAPRMRAGDYYGAIDAGIRQIYSTRPVRRQYAQAFYADERAHAARLVQEARERRYADSVSNTPAARAQRALQAKADAESAHHVYNVFFGIGALMLLAVLAYFAYQWYKAYREKQDAAAVIVNNERALQLSKATRILKALQMCREVISNFITAPDYPLPVELVEASKVLLAESDDLLQDTKWVAAGADASFLEDFHQRANKIVNAVDGLSEKVKGVYDDAAALAAAKERYEKLGSSIGEYDVEAAQGRIAAALDALVAHSGPQQTSYEGYAQKQLAKAKQAYEQAAAPLAAGHREAALKLITLSERELAAVGEAVKDLKTELAANQRAQVNVPELFEMTRKVVDKAFRLGIPAHVQQATITELMAEYGDGKGVRDWRKLHQAMHEQYTVVKNRVVALEDAKRREEEAKQARILEERRAVEREEQRKRQAVIDEENRQRRLRQDEQDRIARLDRQRRDEEEEAERRRTSYTSSSYSSSSSSSSDDSSSDSWGGGSSGGGGGGADW
jgi:uncharacterized membrane protein YgcG